jgi:C-terminal processing protease CtpA/Prc
MLMYMFCIHFKQDLRGNGGGAFQSALGIAGLFMNDKLITYVVSI